MKIGDSVVVTDISHDRRGQEGEIISFATTIDPSSGSLDKEPVAHRILSIRFKPNESAVWMYLTQVRKVEDGA
jgi:hypothetical protein